MPTSACHALQEHAEEHLNAVNGLVSFADARLADMQALYVVVEERLQGMAAAQECVLDLACSSTAPEHCVGHLPPSQHYKRLQFGALVTAVMVATAP